MKRLFVIFLAALMLVSCGKSGGLNIPDGAAETELDIEAGLEKYSIVQTHADYEFETTYSIDMTDMPEDFMSSAYSLLDGRLFMMVPVSGKRQTASSTEKSPAYVNLETGDLMFFCTDPLCSHTADAEDCLFSNTRYPQFYDSVTAVYADNIYTVEEGECNRVYSYNILTGELKVLYECYRDKPKEDDPTQYILTIIISEKGVLINQGYDSEDSENRSVTSYHRYVEYDMSTGKITPLTDWYNNDTNEWLEVSASIWNTYSKESTPHGSSAADDPIPEFLAQFWEDGELYDWFETKHYWYYTHKNTTVFGQGESPSGKFKYDIADHIGGKIYRIPKSAQSADEEEMVFDNFNEFCIQDWMVVGNHIYIWRRDYWAIMSMWHTDIGIIRVNIDDHTMKYLTWFE